ncbi:MAG: PAS domain-containing protein [Comamonadaceae bacterium]|nr:MAG: PAS domain-containing protein [Comamonadaceae bacterium]
MMLGRLSRFLFGTLRGRLVVGVAVVHALMMTLLVADLTQRQRSMLLDRQIEEATALSQALATSGAGWIAADDVSGLQELVEVQRRYPEILFAILADQDGRVLADTDSSRRGSYLLDLPREAHVSVLSGTPALVDIAAPAIVGGRQVGWARVGIGQRVASEKLGEIFRSGVVYAIGAIVIGAVIAWFMGQWITRRLYAVQETINAVRSGDHQARSLVVGDDEAAVMGREFNAMLDSLAQRDAELRASEKKYRSLIHNVQVAIILFDGQGRVLNSNPLAQEMLGLIEDKPQGEALLDPAWHLLKEDGSVLPLDEYPFRKVLSSHQPLRDDVTGISHPGLSEVIWVLANAEPEYDDAGHITQVTVSFVDITERKRAEDALRLSSERLQLATRVANIGIWDWDIVHNELVWDDSMYQLYGIQRGEFGGAYDAWMRTLHPEDKAHTDGEIQAALRGEREYAPEFRIIRTDGSIRYIKADSRTIRDQGGIPLHMIGTNIDITEHKKAEEEILKLNQTLEQRVTERTAELLAANKELEGFSYSVSHDLRAPLRHIDGFLALLKVKAGASLDDKSLHYMNTISMATKRMGTLVDDLLAFLRMRRKDMATEDVDLATLLQEVIQEFEPETLGRDIAWCIGKLPKVTGDRAMLHIVLVNLISNALKFTQKRAKSVIEVGCQHAAMEAIVFIRDNGVGFDMQYADKLFGVFQRLHAMDEFEGSGIGLANVRRIISRHGGRTWAEGKVDGGATFYFSLPHVADKEVMPGKPDHF